MSAKDAVRAIPAVMIFKFTYPSPPPSSQIYVPDPTLHGISLVSARAFEKVNIMIEADQPVDVYVQNSPDGDAASAKDLAGYSISSADFDAERRNTIAIEGASALLGFIRLRIATGATAPTSITVWIAASY